MTGTVDEDKRERGILREQERRSVRSQLATAPVGRRSGVVPACVVVRDLRVLSVRERPHALVRLRLGRLRASMRQVSEHRVRRKERERRTSLLVVAKSGHSIGSNVTFDMLCTCRESGEDVSEG